jgi:3-oxoacyl-[acyl-carrier protein] reductase
MDTTSIKTALIIGGTGGIGLALSIHMAEMEYRVIVTGRSSPESLKEFDPRISSLQASGFFHHIPWTYINPMQGLASLQDALGKEPNIDVLIISFGPYGESSISQATPEQWQTLVESNLIFPGMVTSWIVPIMQKKGGGKILFFGATGSDQIQGKKQTAIYQAAKTGISVLAKSIAKEGAKDGISSIVVCPGYTFSKSTDPDLKAAAQTRVPTAEPSRPADFIPILDCFLHDTPSLMNGAVINCGQGLGT